MMKEKSLEALVVSSNSKGCWNYDLKNTVFSYIPNTAEVSFFGMVHKATGLFINNYAEDKDFRARK